MNFFDDISLYGSNIALITEESEMVSYNALIYEADSIKDKIKDRCLVFCICQNNFETIAGYIGFLRGRVVPVMVSDTLNKDLFCNLLVSYKPQYVWLPSNKINDIYEGEQIYSFRNYVLLKMKYKTDYNLSDELAILLTTSGSTGSPKLVRQSYKNIIDNANAISQYLNISSKDRPITTMPMSYTYGLSIINSHILKGASIILTSKTLMDKLFWELLKTHNASTFGGVPYIYEMLKKLRFERMELPSIKKLTQAGGKLNLELAKEFAFICKNKNIEFIVMYGQTEATARMSYLPGEYSITKAGSIGIAIPGGEFWLEDNDGNIILGNNVSGELVYKGKNVTLGYAESCYDLVKGDENTGVLRTGDIAKRDEDGFYYIVGRKKRFLKLFGNRVNLDEVENLIKSFGYECACVGEDDSLRIYTSNIDNHEDIKKLFLQHTGLNPAGIKIIYINSIPHNESGKILYSALA